MTDCLDVVALRVSAINGGKSFFIVLLNNAVNSEDNEIGHRKQI
jgi:hypothetical protein